MMKYRREEIGLSGPLFSRFFCACDEVYSL